MACWQQAPQLKTTTEKQWPRSPQALTQGRTRHGGRRTKAGDADKERQNNTGRSADSSTRTAACASALRRQPLPLSQQRRPSSPGTAVADARQKKKYTRHVRHPKTPAGAQTREGQGEAHAQCVRTSRHAREGAHRGHVGDSGRQAAGMDQMALRSARVRAASVCLCARGHTRARVPRQADQFWVPLLSCTYGPKLKCVTSL